jgi:hypothetical protein
MNWFINFNDGFKGGGKSMNTPEVEPNGITCWGCLACAACGTTGLTLISALSGLNTAE